MDLLPSILNTKQQCLLETIMCKSPCPYPHSRWSPHRPYSAPGLGQWAPLLSQSAAPPELQAHPPLPPPLRNHYPRWPQPHPEQSSPASCSSPLLRERDERGPPRASVYDGTNYAMQLMSLAPSRDIKCQPA